MLVPDEEDHVNTLLLKLKLQNYSFKLKTETAVGVLVGVNLPRW